MRILVEEGIGALPSKPKTVITPTQAKYVGEEVDEQNICAVSIIRAGDSLLDAVRRVLPAVPVGECLMNGHDPVGPALPPFSMLELRRCCCCLAGKILIQRDESTEEKLPTLSYVKLPADIASRRVLLCDPMLATGGSAKAAIEVLGKAGVTPDRIVFVNVVSCPEGIAAVHSEYSEVTIVTGEVDAGLNEHKYIVPGLGDFGDRIFGTNG